MSAPGFEPADSLPPARRRLTYAMLTHGFQRAEIEEMVNAVAHELAEQQRAALPDVMEHWSGYLHQDTISEVIDAIDPHRSAGPVRPDGEST